MSSLSCTIDESLDSNDFFGPVPELSNMSRLFGKNSQAKYIHRKIDLSKPVIMPNLSEVDCFVCVAVM